MEEKKIDISMYLKMTRTPAGAILKHILTHAGIAQKELADKSGIRPQHINALIKGSRRFSPTTSLQIEEALGIDHPGFFYKLQSTYDIHLSQQARQPKPNISNLSKSTFWDVDLNTVDWQIGAKWAINRVLEYGRENDFLEISKFYGRENFIRELNLLGSNATSHVKRNAFKFGLL